MSGRFKTVRQPVEDEITSGIQYDVDETELPQSKRRRPAGDREQFREASESCTPSIQHHGSEYVGQYTLGPGSSLRQGDTINCYPPADSRLADLRVTDPRDDKIRIEQTKGGLLQDSYCWILDHADFLRWRNNEATRLLWIKGDPGKGKTMLLCGIIDELSPATRLATLEASTLLSYFFCQATDSRINNATAVLRGLIYLLVKQQPSLFDSHVQERHKDAGKQLFEDANAWTALSKIFTSILHDPSLKSTYLIIDALDECETGLEQLLKLVVQNVSLPRVKWIVSSRNRSDIERHLKLDDVQMRLSLELKQNAESVSRAIEKYIDDKVFGLESLRNDPPLRDHIRHVLRRKADGTFLWVALVAQELEKVRSYYIRQVVDEVPEGLDELYARMMDQIQRLERRDPEFCRLVLSAATLAHRPLRLLELGVVSGLPDAISSRVENIEEVVKMSGSFLAVRDGQVFIIHQSAKDYLQKNYRSLQPAGVAQGHADISRRSIDAMSSTLKQNMYKLDFGFKPEDMTPPHPDPLAPIRYSCVFWADHLFLNGESPECRKELTDDGKVFQFLKEYFLRWLEGLSLLGKLSDGVLSIRGLLHIVQQLGASPRFAGFLEDAEKFVRSHVSIIERAPLQSYGSALLFSPTRSVVKNAQWKERLSFIKTVAGIKSNWDTHQTLAGHSGSGRAVAFSPDGKTLASASGDQTVRLWDTATGAHRQTLVGHSRSVRAVAFSPDGRTIASASYDKTVRLWDTATGIYQQTLIGHSRLVSAVAFSPDGRTIVSASYDKTIRLWDTATGTYRQILVGHSHSVDTVAFSPDSKTLVSASGDQTVRLWDTATGVYRQTLIGHSLSVSAVAFSPDGKTVASALYDQTIRLWDTATGAYRQTLIGHSRLVSAVAFSPDGRTIASASDDQTVRLWDTATGTHRQTLVGYSHWVSAVAFSPDGKTVASASYDKTVRLRDTATSAYQQTLIGHSRLVRAVAFSPDGKTVASASDDQTVRLWDTATNTHRQTLIGHSRSVRAVVFSPDGKTLASASYDQTIRLWDTTTGAHQQTLVGYSRSGRAVAFSPDGRTIALASGDQTVRLWDTITGVYRQTLIGHSISVSAVVFSPDGKTVASASDDETIRL